MTDLIVETRSTKEAIDAANEGLHDAQEHFHHHQQQPATRGSGDAADLFALDGTHHRMGSTASHHQAPTIGGDDFNHTLSQSDSGGGGSNIYHPHGENHEVFRPAIIDSIHPRGVSTGSNGFDYGGVMGGSSSAATTLAFSSSQPQPPSGHTADSAAAVGSSHNNDKYAPGSTDIQRLEGLKARVLDAEQTARDAEETRRMLVEQADELRRAADEAEAHYRDLLNSANEHPKKTGFLKGRSNKKKDMVRGVGDGWIHG